MKFFISPPDKTEAVVIRMFYLAWKAVGGPSGMMGGLQDRGPNVSEAEVWQNIFVKGDYPGHERDRPGEPYADYVFGRMMKMGLMYSADSIQCNDRPLSFDYQAWCDIYPSYHELLRAAADELGVAFEPEQVAADA